MTTSVVIISYNTASALAACVRSVVQNGGPEVGEIIIVDNASSDGSADLVRTEFPGVIVVANPENIGFGAAANQGVALARHEFVFLLNADTQLTPGALDALTAAMRRDPSIGLVGPRLMNADGSDQPSGFRHPTLGELVRQQLSLDRLVGRVSRRRPPVLKDEVPVHWLKGAALLGRRADLRALGPFDPSFFMYCEDIDLCHRMRQAGQSVRLVPSAVVRHIGGESSRGAYVEMAVESTLSMYRLYRKHHGAYALRGAEAVFRLVAALKWARDWLRLRLRCLSSTAADAERLRRDLVVWRRVLTLSPYQ